LAKAVGLDVGSHSCKVAVLEGGPKGARLLRFAEVAYQPGESGALTPAVVLAGVKKALSEARAPRHAVSVALPAEQLVLREISVPFTQDEQIKKVAKFEFEPHLHNAAIEDVVIDYLRTGPARQGTRLLVFCAMKPMLRARLEQFGAAGVDPLHLDVDVTALFNVAHAAGVFAEHPNCLLLDIGARTTKAVWVQEGAVKVARSMRLGSESAHRRLETALGGDREAAERALAAEGVPEALARAPAEVPTTLDIVYSVREIEAAVARDEEEGFLVRMLRETARTMPVMPADQRLTRVFVTGGGSLRPRAREKIAEHFGCEVDDLPVLAAVEHRLPPSEAAKAGVSAAVAVGTGLKVLGMDAGEVDLRREEFRFARTFDQVKAALAVGVTLLFFAAFLLWLTQFVKLGKEQTRADALRRQYQQQLEDEVFQQYEEKVANPRLAGRANPDPDVYFRQAQERMATIRSHLKEELGLSTEVPPIRSALETWAAVLRSVQEVRPKINYLALARENYGQEDATVTVVVADIGDVDTLVSSLRRQDQIFKSVDSQQPRPTKEGYYQVEVRIELHEKRADEPAAAAAAAPGELRTATGEEGR
jgi:Tfp pilus assembly PilM family ATPase